MSVKTIWLIHWNSLTRKNTPAAGVNSHTYRFITHPWKNFSLPQLIDDFNPYKCVCVSVIIFHFPAKSQRKPPPGVIILIERNLEPPHYTRTLWWSQEKLKPQWIWEKLWEHSILCFEWSLESDASQLRRSATTVLSMMNENESERGDR